MPPARASCCGSGDVSGPRQLQGCSQEHPQSPLIAPGAAPRVQAVAAPVSCRVRAGAVDAWTWVLRQWPWSGIRACMPVGVHLGC